MTSIDRKTPNGRRLPFVYHLGKPDHLLGGLCDVEAPARCPGRLYGVLRGLRALQRRRYRAVAETWPAELEGLRNQALTLDGPHFSYLHYAIHFSDREQFESAWPHILAVKTQGAPVFLVRGPNFFLGDDRDAGVVVHCPPAGQTENAATPEVPIAGTQNMRTRWMNTTYVELVVDGQIVDLNRIPLPPDTPIVDERFETQPGE